MTVHHAANLILCRLCNRPATGHPRGKPDQFDGWCGTCRKNLAGYANRGDSESPDVLDEDGWAPDGHGIQRHREARR